MRMRTMPPGALPWIFLLAAAASPSVADEAVPAASTPEGIAFFEAKIRPVLIERCDSCHGAKVEQPKGNLRLDSRVAMLRGAGAGPAVVPGQPDESPLIEAIRYQDELLKMPPRPP